MPPNDRFIVDHFGFELQDLTPEQARARTACHAEALRREARTEWAALERDRTSLPSHSELKKLARKVRDRVFLSGEARAILAACCCTRKERERETKR